MALNPVFLVTEDDLDDQVLEAALEVPEDLLLDQADLVADEVRVDHAVDFHEVEVQQEDHDSEDEEALAAAVVDDDLMAKTSTFHDSSTKLRQSSKTFTLRHTHSTILKLM